MSSAEKPRPVLLLVEDDDAMMETLAPFLETRFEVRQAMTVRDAKAMLPGADGVLSDWNLPDGLGADVLELARAANIPAAAMTARMEDNVKDIERCAPEFIFRKPGDFQWLRDRLEQMLAGKK